VGSAGTGELSASSTKCRDGEICLWGASTASFGSGGTGVAVGTVSRSLRRAPRPASHWRILVGSSSGRRVNGAISALQFGKGAIGRGQYVKGFLALGADQLRDTRGDADNLPTSRELAHPGGSHALAASADDCFGHVLPLTFAVLADAIGPAGRDVAALDPGKLDNTAEMAGAEYQAAGVATAANEGEHFGGGTSSTVRRLPRAGRRSAAKFQVPRSWPDNLAAFDHPLIAANLDAGGVVNNLDNSASAG
jgi:hypothetical protein